MTNDMDLWSDVAGTNKTVGKFICEELASNFFFVVHNKFVSAVDSLTLLPIRHCC